jgi:tRNA(fMet)-specific endonuclease VapC
VKYLLDTNICIYLMKEQPPSVAKRFSSLQVGDVGISSITMAELEHGVGAIPGMAASRRAQLEALVKVIPPCPSMITQPGSMVFIRNGSKQLGRNRFDTLIAAQALATTDPGNQQSCRLFRNPRPCPGKLDRSLRSWAFRPEASACPPVSLRLL